MSIAGDVVVVVTQRSRWPLPMWALRVWLLAAAACIVACVVAGLLEEFDHDDTKPFTVAAFVAIVSGVVVGLGVVACIVALALR